MVVMKSGTHGQRGVTRSLKRLPRGCGLLLVVFALALAGVAGSPLAPSKAVLGTPADSDHAQVRIFGNGEFVGSGTLVDRNWVLTVAHNFERPDNPRIYSLRFGVVNNENDQNDMTNLRTLDRIVPAPHGDVAMVHFADPVPSSIQIPSLATQAPARGAEEQMYGWGHDGSALMGGTWIVYDPVAAENAATLRTSDPVFAASFPSGIQPMVTNGLAMEGDSGSGIFSPLNVLAGIFWGRTSYRRPDSSARTIGNPMWRPEYDQPVWQYRQWILDTISGTGSSGEPHDELRRRRLNEDQVTEDDLPMTLPPKSTSPDPTWLLATLTGPGTMQGLVQATCANVTDNSCSFDGTLYNKAPGQVRVGSGREVMVWCKTTDALTVGGSPQQVLQVSFTNAERREAPIGMGWWHVNPSQVTTGKSPVAPNALATC